MNCIVFLAFFTKELKRTYRPTKANLSTNESEPLNRNYNTTNSSIMSMFSRTIKQTLEKNDDILFFSFIHVLQCTSIQSTLQNEKTSTFWTASVRGHGARKHCNSRDTGPRVRPWRTASEGRKKNEQNRQFLNCTGSRCMEGMVYWAGLPCLELDVAASNR